MINNKKSLLITGASSGIGKACALHLDKQGFKVFAGVRNEKDGKALQKEASDKLQPVILDVTKTETIQEALKLISRESEFPLYALVNNAGIGISGVLEVTPESELRKVLEVNVIGLHAVTRACLSLLRKVRGRIINVGSLSSFMAGPGASSYAASKFAVRALSDSLRLELHSFGMSVSLIAPGAIESDIWDKGKEYKKKLRESTSQELLDVYKLLIRASDKMVDKIHPIPAIEVAKAVEHSLTAKKPKFEYLIGKDTKRVYRFIKWPKRFVNWLMTKHLEKAR